MAGKKVAVPMYRVLSGRVNNEEYEAFQKLAAESGGKTISDIVRTVMTDWLRTRQGG